MATVIEYGLVSALIATVIIVGLDLFGPEKSRQPGQPVFMETKEICPVGMVLASHDGICVVGVLPKRISVPAGQ